MATLPVLGSTAQELVYLKLAREIAMGVNPIEAILEAHQITGRVWSKIQRNAAFKRLLESELATWNSALNTNERTKVKAAAIIEEWLPEAYARMNSPQENLTAKTEVAKLVARVAGIGVTGANVEGGAGEKFTVTINMGAQEPVRIEKQIEPKLIDAAPE
jgi:hypothetical protein